jgi:predicted peptidase
VKPIRIIFTLLAAGGLFWLNGCATTGHPAKIYAGKQVAHQLQTTIPIEIGYHLYLPPDYNPAVDTTWPMIFFLHGAGERGDNLELVKKHGPPKLVESTPILQQFIVLSPQCPEGIWWNDTTLITLLDQIVETYRVDPERIYLTGLSMGGFGTWELASIYPDRFAAIAPICGGGVVHRVRRSVRTIPTWVFHGLNDSTVLPEESAQLVEALQKAGGNVKYTTYPDAGHDSWTETYANPELYRWFLSHRLPSRN